MNVLLVAIALGDLCVKFRTFYIFVTRRVHGNEYQDLEKVDSIQVISNAIWIMSNIILANALSQKKYVMSLNNSGKNENLRTRKNLSISFFLLPKF